MIQAFERSFYVLAESETPARSYVEARQTVIERGDIRAEQVTSVYAADEDEEADVVTPVFNRSGTSQLRRGSSRQLDAPPGPAALRKRVALLGAGLVMLRQFRANRAELQGCLPRHFQQYLNYVLGDYVWNLVARSSEGEVVGRSPLGFGYSIMSSRCARGRDSWARTTTSPSTPR